MGTPVYSEDEIVEAGEQLDRAGRKATPHEIHKALGGRGKYSRIAEVWARHREGRSAQAEPVEAAVPARVEQALDALLAEARTALLRLVAQEGAEREAAHRREMLDLRRGEEEREAHWRERLERAEAEAAHLRDLVERYEAEEDEADEAPASPASSAGDGGASSADPARPALPTSKPMGAAAPVPMAAPTPTATPAPGMTPPGGLRGSRGAPSRPIRHDEVRRGGGGRRPTAPRLLARPGSSPTPAPAEPPAAPSPEAKTPGRPRSRPDPDGQGGLPFGT